MELLARQVGMLADSGVESSDQLPIGCFWLVLFLWEGGNVGVAVAHIHSHRYKNRMPVDLYTIDTMKKEYITCINILKDAFDANTTAHKYSELSQNAYWCGDYERASEYSEDKTDFYHKKSKKIEEAICLIKKYKLPIKWWFNDGIVYFCLHWRQISFHTFWKKVYKSYKGKWSCRKNEDKFPINIMNIVL